MNDDLLMSKANRLAQTWVSADVQVNHLAQVVEHLVRHRDLKATAALLNALPNSSFATRTKQTRPQFTALEKHVKPLVERAHDWRDTAHLLGWVRRLMLFHDRH